MNRLLNKLEREIQSREGDGSKKRLRSHVRQFIDDLQIQVNFELCNFPEIGGMRFFQDDGRLNYYINIIEEFSAATGMRLNASKTIALAANNQGLFFHHTQHRRERYGSEVYI